MPKRYIVRLSKKERVELERIVKTGKAAAYKRRNAQILLKTDTGKRGPGWTDSRIADAFGVTARTVERVRYRLCEQGLEAALNRAVRPPRERKIDGADEARLIALSCSETPEGYSQWSLRLLADRFVQLDEVEVDSVSYETIRRLLKKRD